MPRNLVPLYIEAQDIVERSPASACAILRILIEAVIRDRGLRGRHIVRDVGTLVDQGAPVGLLRALDVVAMSEEAAETPAELRLTDGHSDAQNLVMFLHLLADQTA
ncbi:MAG: hypothetical protein VX983_05440 [Actinomycetota bacterium]|nr:hypothetical protein [Acidimicrobiales bacterium]MED5541515.1 hypothetical protein [Actinomycetota bacterium]MEE2807328.1 hypothetical protein [Actinomycetota bacterium]